MTKCRDRFSDTSRDGVIGPFDGEGAKQSFKEECDINRIMGRFLKTGVVDHVSMYEAQYGEVGGLTYHESLNLVRRAERMFMDLPAEARAFFENDAGRFLDFVSDKKNVAKMRELGIVESVDGVPVAAPASSSSSPPAPATPAAT